ncbi:MAG TPA: hypothetical protein VMT19_07170 [Thermoanaerobaculaceae bacterium]|nr:hypothetical protein [Thermoanaerobaculaceae bacterium]
MTEPSTEGGGRRCPWCGKPTHDHDPLGAANLKLPTREAEILTCGRCERTTRKEN